MKKYFFLSVALACSLAFADLKDDLDAICSVAATNRAAAQTIVNERHRLFSKMKYHNRSQRYRLEYDKRLADYGLAMNWWDSHSYPNLSANERKAYGLDVSLAGTVQIAKKYRVNITPYGFMKAAKIKPDEAVVIFNEFITRLDHISTDWLNVFNSYFAEYADDISRDYLKTKGQWSKDAEDALVSKFVEAMAAPYYSGFNDWAAAVGISSRLIDISKFWPEAAVAQLKAEVLAGDMPLTDSFAYRLKTALGVEEWNRFIDEYTKGNEK
jgi:hypothetical protein